MAYRRFRFQVKGNRIGIEIIGEKNKRMMVYYSNLECNYEGIQYFGGSWGLFLLENRTHYLLLLVAYSYVDLVGVSGGGISSIGRNGCIFLFKSLRY